MSTRNPTCACGCGQPAPIAPRTDQQKGWIKGQPLRFIRGHTGGTHGLKGIPFGENLYTRPDGSRECRICKRAGVRRWKAAQ